MKNDLDIAQRASLLPIVPLARDRPLIRHGDHQPSP